MVNQIYVIGFKWFKCMDTARSTLHFIVVVVAAGKFDWKISHFTLDLIGVHPLDEQHIC